MRKLSLLSVLSALAFAAPAFAQQQSPPPSADADPVAQILQVAQVGAHGSKSVKTRTEYTGFNTITQRNLLPETENCHYGDTIDIEAGLALLGSLESDKNKKLPADGVPALLQKLNSSNQIFQLYTRSLLWEEEDAGCTQGYYFALITNGDYRLVQVNYVVDDPDSDE